MLEIFFDNKLGREFVLKHETEPLSEAELGGTFEPKATLKIWKVWPNI